MRLTVVGCAGSFAGPDSPASCYLVQAEHKGRTWNLVLDLGNGALGPLQGLIDLHTIDALVLSHLHPDHCMDVTGLFVVQKYHPARAPEDTRRLPVYGPQDTAARLVRANAVTLSESKDPHGMDPEFDFRVLTHKEPFTVGPFRITPVRVNHPVEAYGVRVEADDKVLVYTGDTDDTPVLDDLLAGADLALTDSAYQEERDTIPGIHLSGRRAATAAVRAGGVKRLMLTHIPVWNDPAECVAEAATVWPGEVELARPGQTYEI